VSPSFRVADALELVVVDDELLTTDETFEADGADETLEEVSPILPISPVNSDKTGYLKLWSAKMNEQQATRPRPSPRTSSPAAGPARNPPPCAGISRRLDESFLTVNGEFSET
jgi:hypothetical protein